MAKTVGRNDPCPCGSGKKYKKCCQDKDQAAAATARVALATAMQDAYDDFDELDERANQVVDLVDQKRFTEAEVAARDVMRRFPDHPDGQEKLALVYEARGDRAAAHATYTDLEKRMPSLDGFKPDREYLKWLRGRIAATAP
jgi:hypothetical protein